ncbi:TonB-dependent receptor [Sphingomonas sp. H39-1-10]|uniref:TonB-dependent receptor plug domain-containing protein n=1 Tax=Sphingomonas pollutisoli TaxID=3030829 RepID=UPI0023B9E2A4|nr:TonB-dependent receptor [Sphingomonas pollutisoli]MDF0489850.1 TonB-dependent receptor [Sphingomonas pollutisoli]
MFALAVASAWSVPVLAATEPAPAPLADPAPQAEEGGTDIIVTGTRTTGMRAADSPAPIQILGADALSHTGSPDLLQSLAQQLPSIQAQSFGSDLQAHTLQMKLRGLSPNHTLILVNGKRRHGTANVSVAGGPFGGSAAPDISFIVPESIDHVEVLQDGAAAQYGTDAIAGVINFIQKKSDHGGSLDATGGKYYDEGGQTYAVGGNIGIAPFDGAYFNVAAQKKYKNYSFRGDINPQATSLSTKYPAIKDLPGYPYTNRIIGDPKIEQTVVSYNAGYEFGDFKLYSFGSYGHKKAKAYENTRPPTTVVSGAGTTAAGGVAGVPFYPGGFQPQETIDETDYSFTGGFSGSVGDTTFDIASTYGNDDISVDIINTANAQLYRDTGYTPTNIHDGSFYNTQWTNTLDLTHPFDIGLAGPVNVAGGLEFRHEEYGIRAGDPASYYGGGTQSFFGYSPKDAGKYKRDNFSQYLDVSVKPIDAWLIDGAVRHEHYSDFGDTTVFKLTTRYDFSAAFALRGTVSTGFRAPTLAEGGYSGLNVGPSSISGVLPPSSAGAASLGFGGLKPEKSTNFSAGFVFHPVPKLSMTVDAYQITIRNRIMISSGFAGFTGNRCPQGYNGSNAAACLPFDQDLYNINNQLAVLSAVNTALGGSGNLTSLAQATAIPVYVLYAPNGVDRATDGTVAVQSFVNGVKMRTRGVDMVINYPFDLGDFGSLDLTFTGNYNENKVLKINPLPSALYSSTQNPGLTQLIATSDVTQLENSTPKFRGTLNGYWQLGGFSVNLRESFYSEVYALETARTTVGNIAAGSLFKVPVKDSFLTDLEVGYQIAKPIKISFGANNLFNKYPTQRSKALIRDAELKNNERGYSTDKYPLFSPFGINGGYYYARLNLTW